MTKGKIALFLFAVVIPLCIESLASETVQNDHTQPSSQSIQSLKHRAAAWFKSTDPKARRIQMREMTRALKQPCRYCHSQDFRSYTDKYLISLEMMAWSAEQNVRCSGCHVGKEKLSVLGEKAKTMMKISETEAKDCRNCHESGARYRKLTQAGTDYLEKNGSPFKKNDRLGTPANETH